MLLLAASNISDIYLINIYFDQDIKIIMLGEPKILKL